MQQFAARFGILRLVVGTGRLYGACSAWSDEHGDPDHVPTATVAETFEPPQSDFAQAAITTR